MSQNDPPAAPVDPAQDWISRRELARLLGVSPQTAHAWDGSGKLKVFEHGMPGSRYRRFSRLLVERYFKRSWENAIQAQEELLARAGTSQM